MNNNKIKIINGLNEIMKLSYPICKSDNPEISETFSLINNIAHDLKKLLENSNSISPN
jgi:hypothetical protein